MEKEVWDIRIPPPTFSLFLFEAPIWDWRFHASGVVTKIHGDQLFNCRHWSTSGRYHEHQQSSTPNGVSWTTPVTKHSQCLNLPNLQCFVGLSFKLGHSLEFPGVDFPWSSSLDIGVPHPAPHRPSTCQSNWGDQSLTRPCRWQSDEDFDASNMDIIDIFLIFDIIIGTHIFQRGRSTTTSIVLPTLISYVI